MNFLIFAIIIWVFVSIFIFSVTTIYKILRICPRTQIISVKCTYPLSLFVRKPFEAKQSGYNFRCLKTGSLLDRSEMEIAMVKFKSEQKELKDREEFLKKETGI